MRKKDLKNKIVVYQAKTGAIELRGDFSHETIWATQADIVKLFEKNQSVISRHITAIFKDGEVNKKSNMQKMHIANSNKPVIFYSLDVILAVGYRANSSKAVEFRKWATQILRQHIIKGYTVNPQRIKDNYAEFMKAVADLKILLPSKDAVDSLSVLELISAFAETWLSLDAYDRDELTIKGATKKSVSLTAAQLTSALTEFKATLITKGMASELFGLERQQDALAGIVGNVMQSFGGQAVYPTIEEKAAHLLYFVVKNHPFIDGNKRSGAYVFIWFLQKTGLLNRNKITTAALTALTLLIAESAPKYKERMVHLTLHLLKK